MMTVVERFWSKVDTGDGCWEWTGNTNGRYGTLSVKGKPFLAHRFSAMLHFGMFDRRHVVMHTCDNTRCVRPEHLRLGSPSANTRDMYDKGRQGRRLAVSASPECRNGHDMTGPNEAFYPNGHRYCRACKREQAKVHYRKSHNPG